MRLSDHFTLQEFIDSAKATELNLANIPNQIHIMAMQLLCDTVLEPIRKHFNAPMRILSGFRSKELNAAVGGAPTSQHTLGEAADITISGIKNDELWKFIVMNINYDQVIAEHLNQKDGSAGWVHVSHSRVGNQRNQPLSCVKNGIYMEGLHYV